MKKKIVVAFSVAVITGLSYVLFNNQALATESDTKVEKEVQQEIQKQEEFNFMEPDTDIQCESPELTMKDYQELLDAIPEGCELVIHEEMRSQFPDEVQDELVIIE